MGPLAFSQKKSFLENKINLQLAEISFWLKYFIMISFGAKCAVTKDKWEGAGGGGEGGVLCDGRYRPSNSSGLLRKTSQF